MLALFYGPAPAHGLRTSSRSSREATTQKNEHRRQLGKGKGGKGGGSSDSDTPMMGSKSGKKGGSSSGDRTDDNGGGGPGIDIDLPCTTLPNNTATALYQAMLETPDGGTLTLCGGTTIPFDQELKLSGAKALTVECVNGRCVFHGLGQHRLFLIGKERVVPPPTWTERPPAMISELTFRNIIFENGFGATDYSGSQVIDGGGGAFQVTGIISDALRFEGCTFRNNTARESHRVGALDILSATPFSRLYLHDCEFFNNTAHQGGAIYGNDIAIFLNGTSFVDNRICGAELGPAIYQHETHELVHVECIGDLNLFENNRDDLCLSSASPPNTDIPKPIVGCTENCGTAAHDHCRIE